MSADVIGEVAFVFLVGLCIGSFLNTCIFRIPRGLSILHPRSRCSHCENSLGIGQLIPLWSYIWQRGRCIHCGEKIPGNYFIVELSAALLAVASFRLEGISIAFLQTFCLSCVFLAIAVVDYHHRIIPDEFVIVGLIFAFLGVPWSGRMNPLGAALGFLIGGFSFLIAQVLYRKIRGREGMGGGDVKLSALIGSALGFGGWLQAILVGSSGGVIAGLFLIVMRKADLQTPIPYGTFLSAGAIIMLLVPEFLL